MHVVVGAQARRHPCPSRGCAELEVYEPVPFVCRKENAQGKVLPDKVYDSTDDRTLSERHQVRGDSTLRTFFRTLEKRHRVLRLPTRACDELADEGADLLLLSKLGRDGPNRGEEDRLVKLLRKANSRRRQDMVSSSVIRIFTNVRLRVSDTGTTQNRLLTLSTMSGVSSRTLKSTVSLRVTLRS